MKFNIGLTLVLAAALVGCAGTKFSFERARQVQVGMSETQLTELMGKPYMVKSTGDTQVWVWSHANGLTGGTQMVSFEVKDGKVSSVPSIPAAFK